MGKRLKEAGITKGHEWQEGDWAECRAGSGRVITIDLVCRWVSLRGDVWTWLPTTGQLLEMLRNELGIERYVQVATDIDYIEGTVHWECLVRFALVVKSWSIVRSGQHLADLLGEVLLALREAT